MQNHHNFLNPEDMELKLGPLIHLIMLYKMNQAVFLIFDQIVKFDHLKIAVFSSKNDNTKVIFRSEHVKNIILIIL